MEKRLNYYTTSRLFCEKFVETYFLNYINNTLKISIFEHFHFWAL